MLRKKEYYEIFIYNNEIAVVEKVDYDIYNYFKGTFEYGYHTKSGEIYPLEMNLTRGTYILIVDKKHLYDLLDDLREQGFCDTIELRFIDDYFSGDYKQFKKAF